MGRKVFTYTAELGFVLPTIADTISTCCLVHFIHEFAFLVVSKIQYVINLVEVYLINLFNETFTMNTETPNIISQTQNLTLRKIRLLSITSVIVRQHAKKKARKTRKE